MSFRYFCNPSSVLYATTPLITNIYCLGSPASATHAKVIVRFSDFGIASCAITDVSDAQRNIVHSRLFIFYLFSANVSDHRWLLVARLVLRVAIRWIDLFGLFFLVFGQDIFTTQKRSRNNFTDFLMLIDAKLYINISLLTYYI